MLDLPFQKFDVVGSGLALVLVRKCQHLIRHVQAVRLACWSNTPGREQDIDAATGAQIENNFTGVQFGQCCRVSAPERSLQRLSRNLLHLRGVIKIRSNRIATRPARVRRPATTPALSPQRRLPVFFLNDFLDVRSVHAALLVYLSAPRSLRTSRTLCKSFLRTQKARTRECLHGAPHYLQPSTT